MILKVIRNKQSVGYCKLLRTTSGDYEIAYMKIEPAYRGLRLASQLLGKAKAIADRDGTGLVALLDPDGTGLTREQERSWLKRHGFKYEKKYDLSNRSLRTLGAYLRHKPNYKSVMIYKAKD